jgi:hypothetical protein
LRIPYILSMLLGLALSAIYIFQAKYPDFMYVFSNAFPPIIAGVAVVFAGLALKRYWGRPNDKFSRIWLAFTIGMIFWFLGELGWAIYTLALSVEIPYPSIADAAWILGYIPLFAAFHGYVKNFQFTISKKLFRIGALIIDLVCLGIFAYFVMTVFADMAGKEALALAFDIAYPALDLCLLGYALLALLIFMRGRIAFAWALISSALVMFALADMLFTYTTLQGTYFNGHPLELAFHFGYILYALAFYVHTKEL